jgi:hypothetical protein
MMFKFSVANFLYKFFLIQFFFLMCLTNVFSGQFSHLALEASFFLIKFIFTLNVILQKNPQNSKKSPPKQPLVHRCSYLLPKVLFKIK